MKLFYSLLALCMLFTGALSAQNINWAFNVGGTLTNTNDIDESGVFVLNDGTGNLIDIGNFKGTADFDPSAAVVSLTSTSTTLISTYIAKYDTNKNLLWAKKIDNMSAYTLQDASVDKAGNFYIVGSVTQDTNFDLNGGSSIFNYNSTNPNFVAKYNTNGGLIWVYNFIGVSKVTTDDLNNLYVYGTLGGATDIDVTAGVYTLTPATAGGANYFAKYDVNLNVLMAQKIERGTASSFASIDAITTDNTNIYITGEYSGTVDFDPSAATANIAITPTGVPHSDPYFAKYNGTTGAMAWAKSIVCNGQNAFIHASADVSGNLYIIGFTSSTTMDFDPSAGVLTKTGSGGSDSYLAKYTTNGDLSWVNYFLNMSDFSFVLSPQHVYLHAMAAPPINLNPSGAQPFYINAQNNFIGAYNLSNGTLDWASGIGGANQVTLSPSLLYGYGGHSIAVDAQENVYATGCYYPVPGNTVSDFDPTPNVYQLTLNGDRTDSYLVKYSPLKLDFTTNKSAYCQGETMTINFNPFGYYPAGNQYTFLLSDATGSFATPVTLSTPTTSAAGSFTYVIPANTAAGTGYKIRMTASNPSTVPVIEKSIVINGLPATPVITGTASVCGNAQSKTYSITPHSGSTYAWTPPANATISGSSTNQQVVLNFSGYIATGNVLVTETDALGCGSAQASFSIAPLAVPSAPVVAGSASVCGNASARIYSVTNTAGSSYTWNFPSEASNSAAANSNSLNLTFNNFTVTSTISVKETNSVGCTGLISNFTVSPLALPATSSITGSSSVCANATSQSYSVTNTTGSSYAWSVLGNGSIAAGQGANAVTVNYNTFSGGSVVVVETNSASCIGEPVSLTVTGLATPVTSSITGAASLCGNSSNAPYSVTAHAGNTYAWSFPSLINVVSGTGTNAVTVTANGFVTGSNAIVTETNTSSGCSGLPVSLFITPLVVPVNTITGVASICGNAKGVNYSVPATAGSTYSWTYIPGAAVVGASNQHAIQYDCTNFAGGFTLKVHETTAAGCTGPDATLNLTALAVPVPNPLRGPAINCYPGNTLVYSTTATSYLSSYQWTIPSNTVAETVLNQYYVNAHFTDQAGGVLKLTETLNSSGCSYDNLITVDAYPVVAITGPAIVCGQPVAGYTFSTPDITGATYGWRYPGQATAQGSVSSSSIQLIFNNFTSPSQVVASVISKGCYVSARYDISPKTSPNLPSIDGPSFTCITANNADVQYKPDHVNNGYRYTWLTTLNMPVVTNDLVTNTVDIDLSTIANRYTTGVITLVETDLTDNCVVSQVKKTISGYTQTPYLTTARRTICDVSKDYIYSVGSPEATSTYHWTPVQNTTVVSGDGSNTATMHYNTAASASFSLTQTNVLGCTTSPFTFPVLYNASQYIIPSQQVSCANAQVTVSIGKPVTEPGVNKMEIVLTYNNAFASLATVNPYTLSNLYSSSSVTPVVSVTETTPGTVKIIITAPANTYLLSYSPTTFLDLHFDLNHSNMQVGNVITFATSNISEYFLDGSVDNCNTVAGTVTKVATSSTLNGTLVYSNNSSLKLGYNSAQPSQYLVTNISGTSDCSTLSSPVVPAVSGTFTYDLSNGNNLSIKRDIAATTSVNKYINAEDAYTAFKIITGFNPVDVNMYPVNIYALLASDVNRDGKITTNDYEQILYRGVNVLHEYTTEGATPIVTPDWNFIDEYTLYNSAAYKNTYLKSSNTAIYSYDLAKTLPIIPSCLPIRYNTNGACIEAPSETYHGILMGDVSMPSPFLGGNGWFDNAPNSNMRTQYTIENNATVFVDLSDVVQLPNNKVRFPLYFFAADTAQSLDVQLDYDQTKIKIDTIEHSTEEINEDFIFAYNDDHNDVLKISGFGPEKLLSNVTLLNITVTLLDGNISKAMLGNFDLTLVNGNPAQGQIIDATATAIVESEAFKNVRLFPNPTTGQLQLTGLENIYSTVTIVNTLGVPVTKDYVNASTMDVSDLAAGLYYVKISIDGSDKMIRFIKL